MTCRLLIAGFLLWLVASPCLGQEDQGSGIGKFESWIVLEEEAAPEPPLIRLHLGLSAWVEARTRVQVGGSGTRLQDLEENQGLSSGAVGPWAEFSIGGKLRFGADVSWTKRYGQFERQDAHLTFDAIHVAEPADLVKASFEFLTVALSVEWDVLYGRTYRIGLLGGVRHFRMSMELVGVRGNLAPRRISAAEKGELVSPYFGGLVELTPFPFFTVYTKVQFMNWTWQDVNLRDARFLEFRLGVAVNLIPDTFGLSLAYRFLAMRALADDGVDRFEGALAANGVVVSINFSF